LDVRTTSSRRPCATRVEIEDERTQEETKALHSIDGAVQTIRSDGFDEMSANGKDDAGTSAENDSELEESVSSIKENKQTKMRPYTT